MEIRRPVVTAVTALVLLGGGAALTGCSDTDGLGQRSGTSKDSTDNLSGNDPTDVSQGSVYNHGNQDPAGDVGIEEGAPVD
ncbi:hypothetical protein [Klenkia terrae]|uniref:Prokaryotic membrane lipoprotein lipid attachment site profile n=1 Tax=Klenkia terrae TaxID=1052259 RepID=A0ABU8ED53_9ACTN|nr:hypothetical protein [Klenkia terrae]SSC25835.1 Hypothetical protein KLENKIAIHU_4461 [Klenkia terrae]